MLPANWKPRSCQGLVRVGPREDGGYVISESILHNTEVLFGLGIAEDWRFEEEFQKKTGCSVVCFDHRITSVYWRQRFELDLIGFLCGRRFSRRSMKRMFKYFEYKRFFDGKIATHCQTMIGYPANGARNIHQLLATSGEKKAFFKIDIEGWEYRIFDQLTEHSKQIVGFVVEFHDVDLHRERISMLIESARKDFELVHIHANNLGGTDPMGDPLVIEMTWTRRDLFTPGYSQGGGRYPVPELDYPNCPLAEDIPISFEGEVE